MTDSLARVGSRIYGKRGRAGQDRNGYDNGLCIWHAASLFNRSS